MKSFLLLLPIICIFSLCSFAQGVGITDTGAATPNSNAVLDVSSDTRGTLLPRLTTVARNTLGTALTNAEDGMLVYDKDVTIFYYWDGPNLQWMQVGTGSGDLWGSQVVQTAGTNITGDGTASAPLTVTEVDGSITNELQTISETGNVVTLSNNGGSFTDDDTQLSEAQVDNFVSNNGYLTSFTEVDGSVTNELQNIAGSSFNGSTGNLAIGIQNGTGQTINLNGLKDHDWYETGGTIQPNNINDDIYTQGRVGIGTTNPTRALTNIDGNSSFANVASGNTGQNVKSFSWHTNLQGFSAAIINTSTANGSNGLQVRTEHASANSKVMVLGTGISSLANANTDYLTVLGNGNVGVGVSTPSDKLQVQGKVKIVDGTQGTGKVFTSDASGKGSWESIKRSGLFSNTAGANSWSGEVPGNDPPFIYNLVGKSNDVLITKTSQYEIQGNVPLYLTSGVYYIGFCRSDGSVFSWYELDLPSTPSKNVPFPRSTMILSPGTYYVGIFCVNGTCTGSYPHMNLTVQGIGY